MLFGSDFDLLHVLEQVKTKGYWFCNDVDQETLSSLITESDGLYFEYGDHINYPINRHEKTSVKQSHERAYKFLNDTTVPTANSICYGLSSLAKTASNVYPELDEWLPCEIGYQRYRGDGDFIGPHRDRASDQFLSVTFTIAGSAVVKIHESLVAPPDYSQLKQIDEWLTVPGTVMFLRAPGFGSGERVIHEVMSPIGGPRIILNLRMRSTILKSPSEYNKG